MNSLIKKQLDICKVNIPDYDDATTSIFIPRTGNYSTIELQAGKYYIIKLEKYILHPPETFTLNSNWNGGINPVSEYLFGTPIKIVGKMVQFDCCGYSIAERRYLDDVYSGLWLPSAGFKVLEEHT